MEILKTIQEVRTARQKDKQLTWGVVPTMGYLHAGHLSLVQKAKENNDRTAVSIFVNPTQFAPTEDLSTYPRNLERDIELLTEAGVDYLFLPTTEMMYPPHHQTKVIVETLSKPLEGASRPTHFEGVTTIVAKLFNIFQAERAYFGQKDAQQVRVIQQMVRDLNFAVEVVVCPIVREADGLAMSSRNSYLDAAERQTATILSRSLMAGKRMIEAGECNADKIRSLMQDMINDEPLALIDYISIADAHTLKELNKLNGEVLISLAVYIGQARLIDNLKVHIDT